MKNTCRILMLLSFALLIQDCSSNSIENDFTYQSTTNTADLSSFRNRKYDYARVKIITKQSLKIPAGLSGEKIRPALKTFKVDSSYAKLQLKEIEKAMLPPNYASEFDMSKIIDDQTFRVIISTAYDDFGLSKLIFGEPFSVTINLLEKYFKDNDSLYQIISKEDQIFSGYSIMVKYHKKALIFVIKINKLDDLTSLVRVSDVFAANKKAQLPNYVNERVRILNDIRKALDNTRLKGSTNLQIIKKLKANLAASKVDDISNTSKPDRYDKNADKSKQQQSVKNNQSHQD